MNEAVQDWQVPRPARLMFGAIALIVLAPLFALRILLSVISDPLEEIYVWAFSKEE